MRAVGYAAGRILAVCAILGLPPNASSSWADSTQAELTETASTQAESNARVDFNRDIRPIFQQHCLACHGGVKQAADLSFVYADQALSIITPGDPEGSYLFERVTATDESERMPPAEHGPGLSEQELGLLRQWIEQGAVWQPHWSFMPPRRSKPPAVSQATWMRQPLDRFVLARLEKNGWIPSPEASAERWLRRVSLDLTGVSPTPSQRAAFLENLRSHGELAYAWEVDRLLQSPRFGERWATMWLDLLRYADSKGLGQDGRRTIWKYRDWVIDAFNRDMPFDQFTIKQIAGDLLPDRTLEDLVATAGHRLTQTNEEGGTDDEQFRTEAVIDRVNTTWQAWQGLTFGCVQCHNHPYDPIRHEEYYAFLSYFNNTVDTDLSNDAPHLQVPLDDRQYDEAMKLDRKIDELKRRDWQVGYRLLVDESIWKPVRLHDASSPDTDDLRIAVVDAHDEFQTAGTVARTKIVVETKSPQLEKPVTAIRLLALPADPDYARTYSEWGFVLSHVQADVVDSAGKLIEPIEIDRVVADEFQPLLDPQLSLNPDSSRGFGAYTRIHYPRMVALVLQEPVALATGQRIRLTLAHNVFELGAFPLVTKRGRIAVTGDERFTQWLTDGKAEKRRARIRTLQDTRSQIASVGIPVLRERPEHLARPTHVFDRGNFLTKGDPVEPGTPDFLSGNQAADEAGGDRLQLAHWIASADNPLIGRVLVNRVWAQMFGTGLVETQEDFGSSGSLPTHPRLLDDLAVRFVADMQWSMKRLLREIALSATYRQASRVREQPFQTDPDNRLLWRGPRHRLPAETIRDQALAIGGILSLKMHGPPVHPPLPDGVWNPFQASDKWETPPKGKADRYRRSIYTYTKRTIPYPMFVAFDAPSREFCTTRRLLSNTPLQALMTLNDKVFMEASRGLADRMHGHSPVLDQQLRYGMLLATARQPADEEIEVLRQLYLETIARLAPPIEASDKNTAANDKAADRRKLAMTNVANVLLNMDEVLTK